MGQRLLIAAVIALLVIVLVIVLRPEPSTDAPAPATGGEEPIAVAPAPIPDTAPQDGVESPEAAAAESRPPDGLAITGRIIVPPGVGLEGVEVFLRTPMFMDGNVHRRVKVAPDGTFREEGLPPNRYRIGASVGTKEERYGAGAYADAGGPEVVLIFERWPEQVYSRWRIRFQNPDGSPIESGKVFVTYLGDASLQRSEREIVDGVLDLLAADSVDRIFVEVERANEETGAGAALWGPLESGGPEIVLRLSPALAIEGIVTPATEVVVEAVPSAHPLPKYPHRPSATTDETGRFRIEGLGPGEHDLTLLVPDGFVRGAPVKARPGDTVHLKLTPAVAATLEVVEPGEEPISDAEVYLSWPDDDESRVPTPPGGNTDADGRVTLRQLDPDARYVLEVWPDDDRFLAKTIDGWRPADTRIRMTTGLPVAGVVRNRSGAPVVGVEVHLRRTGTKDWGESVEVVRDGRFTFDRQHPGTWDLGLEIRGPSSQVRLVRSVAAGEKDVVLVVDAGLLLHVEIESWGRRAERIGPWLSEEGGPARLRGTHRSEQVRFAGLEAGKTYTLQIGPFSDGMLVFERGIPAEAGSRKVRLKQGGTIRGRIELPAGLRGERVEVVAVGPGFGARGRVEYSGEFRITGVPDGEWTVRARGRTDGTDWSATTRARPGAHPGSRVELKLERRN